jgi:hypothetical protein
MRMAKAITIAAIYLVCFLVTNVPASRQANEKPLGKDEVLAMLKQTGPRKISQGDIVEQIDRRGVSFKMDDKVADELRAAGARSFLIEAIRHAIEDSNRPKLEAPREPAEDAARSEESGRPSDPALPLLEQARRHALEFAGDLPNFVVTQMVTRYSESPGTKGWQLDDKLEIELTYRADKGEDHRLLRVNGSPSNQSYENLVGSISSGEFGAVLVAAFAPQSQAEFKEIKHERLNGRDTVIYDFKIKKGNSANHITDRNTRQSIVAAYKGSVWIDTESKQVLRIEESSEGIPASFPISLAEDAIEYDWVKIADERYLLPVRAEVLLGRDREKYYTRNVIEFRNYHKFEGAIRVVPN